MFPNTPLLPVGTYYSANLTKTTVTNAGGAIDFLEIKAPTGKCVLLHEFRLAQDTEFGDAASEQIHLILKRGVGATSGADGATVTPGKLESNGNSPSPGSTVKSFNTTQASAGSGSLTTILEDAFRIEDGLHWRFTRPVTIQPTEILVVSLGAAVDDDASFCGYAIFQEVGSSGYLKEVTA